MTRQIPTPISAIHAGDTIKYQAIRRNVIRNTRESNGTYTLTLQVPGNPVQVIRDADPGFLVTRIGF